MNPVGLERRRHLNVDGSALPNPGPLSVGCVYVDDNDVTHRFGTRLERHGDNNTAEALAIVVGLRWCGAQGFPVHTIWSDSRVVVDALTGGKTSTLPDFSALLKDAADAVDLAGARICWLPRHRNGEADAVARAAFQMP